jgi:C4-type Zn-finger protein
VDYEDVENGYLDGEISESYIYNIEGIMIRQQEIIDERNS